MEGYEGSVVKGYNGPDGGSIFVDLRGAIKLRGSGV